MIYYKSEQAIDSLIEFVRPGHKIMAADDVRYRICGTVMFLIGAFSIVETNFNIWRISMKKSDKQMAMKVARNSIIVNILLTAFKVFAGLISRFSCNDIRCSSLYR